MYSFFFSNDIASVGFNDIQNVSLLKYIEILVRFETHRLENRVIAIIANCISATIFHEKKKLQEKLKNTASSFLTHIAPTQITAKQPVLYIKIHFSSLCAIIDIIFYGNDVLYVLRILDTALLINNPDRSLNNYHISEGYKNSTTYLKNE